MMDDLQKRLRLNLSLKFIIGVSITLIITLGISFYVIAKRQERLIIKQVENEARTVFTQIVLTRKWIADHGGIFVEKLPWVKPNPYLREVGKETEITDTKGRVFVMKNPAIVTRELSQYAKAKGLYWFRITSLKPINPENSPDEFERMALLEFENSGAKEFTSSVTIEGLRYLRYVSPLYVEEACLGCHAKQGYKIGDVRGAISVTIPMDKAFAEVLANRKNMLIAAVLIVLSLTAIMFFMMRKLVLTPVKRLKSSIKEFSEGYHPERTLKTGDEFEDLYRTFSEMAKTLTEYHHCMNDKIKAATKDLEETNRKLIEANRLLNEANLKKSDFIARASHELRTPLTSIKGAMDYISTRLSSISMKETVGEDSHREGTSLDDLHTFLEIIKRNSERLIRMVNEMLDLERIEAGVYEFHFTDINLSQLIRETVASFQLECEERKISLNVNIPENLLVCVDEDRIRQVLSNFLSNAIKFSPPRSEIILFAYLEREFVVVEVWDDGPGIPLEERDKIFEKFYKLGNKEGTGLGLAICKGIIEAHYGIIGVKSDGKNGSCFYFKLPNEKCAQDRRLYSSISADGS